MKQLASLLRSCPPYLLVLVPVVAAVSVGLAQLQNLLPPVGL